MLLPGGAGSSGTNKFLECEELVVGNLAWSSWTNSPGDTITGNGSCKQGGWRTSVRLSLGGYQYVQDSCPRGAVFSRFLGDVFLGYVTWPDGSTHEMVLRDGRVVMTRT